MTSKNNKEKIILDKDALFQAYVVLDKMYMKTYDSDIDFVHSQFMKATGYKLEHSLKKVKRKLNDFKK